MPSYLITGANRGLGYEFLKQYSEDPKSTVIATVRDKATAQKKISEELSGRSNIHLLEGDVTNYEFLKSAATETAKITGGSLDYLIANAGYVSYFDPYDGIGTLAQSSPKGLDEDIDKLWDINVKSQIHLFALFMPLILKGTAKKVIGITSGHADGNLVNEYELWHAPLYSISKAAFNLVVSKFHAQYKKDGVTFLALSPGAVATSQPEDLNAHQQEAMNDMGGKFMKYEPTFRGWISTEDSISSMRKVIDDSTPEKTGGAFISHNGDRGQWLRVPQ